MYTSIPIFDILSMLNDLEDEELAQQMVIAATQVEQNMMKTSIVKKNDTRFTAQQTFQNCIFGNIGALNIHIHKN